MNRKNSGVNGVEPENGGVKLNDPKNSGVNCVEQQK